MAFTIVLPANTTFSVADIPEIVDFISTEAELGSRYSATQFSGSGLYEGQAATYSALGTGFTTDVSPGGLTYIATGMIDTITVTTISDSISITDVDIDMLAFAPIRLADLTGAQPLAIENYVMARDWNITLGDLDDIFPEGSMIGDGAPLNNLGDDVFRGGRGNDNLFSGDGADIVYGNWGDDILSGGYGKDSLRGGIDNDTLYGGYGRDRLLGQDGDDRLDSGRGHDYLTGGEGNDVFVFANRYGNDEIRDFEATNDDEYIDLSAVTRIKSFNDLIKNHMTQSGDDVVIYDNHHTTITILNVDLADLDSADFMF